MLFSKGVRTYNMDLIALHAQILASSLFRIDGERIDLPAKMIELADAVKAAPDDESIWYIGEFSEACLDDLIVGAYWAFSEWHAGQASDSYAALCALGSIFNPGMTNAPDEDSSAWPAYSACEGWFHARAYPNEKVW